MTEQKIRKGMIVAREESLIIAKALGQVLKIVNVAVDVCDHGSALNTFLETEPEICIVMDYSERAESAGFPGKKTFKMLKATAESHQKLIKVGFETCADPDYLQLPFMVVKLYQLIG
ncbi:MAG: hypothetical protein AAB793_02665 [Patescibacteria group bacterium]